jgi:hypothetical protein
MLSDKYKNNQDVLNITKDILNARSSDLFTPQEFNRVFGIVKKDTGIVFKDLVKQTTQDIEAKRVEAENYLLNKLGINREQARPLLNRFNVEFDNGIILARSKGGAVRMEPTKGEKVADKLFAYNQNTRATQEDRQVATDVMNQYLLIARQFFQNIGDINTLTPDQKLKLLRDSIRKVSTEQSKYAKLHQDAINIVKEKYKNDKILHEHEIIHWNQYKRMGSLLFLIRYIFQFIFIGYDTMPLELEARQSDSSLWNYRQRNWQ